MKLGVNLINFGPGVNRQSLEGWVTQAKIRYREEMIIGLEHAPRAFVGLLRGEAFGKRVIKLSD